MVYLICYDVATDTKQGRRRLRRIAQACKDYGQRVQKSVFECRLSATDWVRLRARLLSEMDASEDSLRVYLLDQTAVARVEHYGIAKPPDLDGLLVV